MCHYSFRRCTPSLDHANTKTDAKALLFTPCCYTLLFGLLVKHAAVLSLHRVQGLSIWTTHRKQRGRTEEFTMFIFFSFKFAT